MLRNKTKIVSHFNLAVVATLSYFTAFLSVIYIFDPIQHFLLPELESWSSLVFTGHGVRVIFIWLFAAYGVVPLFVAHLITGLLLFSPSPDMILIEYLAAAAIGALSAFLAFEAFRFAGHSFYARTNPRVNWRVLILIGFISSIFNSVGTEVIYDNFIADEHHLSNIMLTSLGDTIGVIACLFILLLGRRLLVHGLPRPADL